jgi:UDP-glucose 4-epimerase
MTAEPFQNKRVLITGGLGFIGSNLARRLVDAGADVLLVDNLFPEYGGNRFNIAGIESRVRLSIADVRDAAGRRAIWIRWKIRARIWK